MEPGMKLESIFPEEGIFPISYVQILEKISMQSSKVLCRKRGNFKFPVIGIPSCLKLVGESGWIFRSGLPHQKILNAIIFTNSSRSSKFNLIMGKTTVVRKKMCQDLKSQGVLRLHRKS